MLAPRSRASPAASRRAPTSQLSIEVAKRPDMAGKTIVTFAPSRPNATSRAICSSTRAAKAGGLSCHDKTIASRGDVTAANEVEPQTAAMTATLFWLNPERELSMQTLSLCCSKPRVLGFAGAAARSALADPTRLASPDPQTHDNLSVYFIRGTSAPGPVPLTLQEALSKGSVHVLETGTVNELKIENTGSEDDVHPGGRHREGWTAGPRSQHELRPAAEVGRGADRCLLRRARSLERARGGERRRLCQCRRGDAVGEGQASPWRAPLRKSTESLRTATPRARIPPLGAPVAGMGFGRRDADRN